MLRGIAKAGDDDLPEDRYADVVSLSHLSRSIADAEGERAFAAAAETATTLLRVPSALVFLREANGSLSLAGIAGVSDDERVIPAAQQYALKALSTGTPIVHPNVAAETSPEARDLSRANIVSLMCVPMRVADSNVGAVVVMSADLRAFSPTDIGILQVVASQAALQAYRPGLSTAVAATDQSHEDLVKLGQRKIQELSLINQVSHAFNSTLDLDKLLDIALEQSMKAVGADGGSLMLVNEDTRRLEIVASRGLSHKWVETTSQPIGESIAGWVAEHGESVLVTNAHEDPRFRMVSFRDTITSSASVPLRTKGAVIGVLNVNTVRADTTFDERDLELLETVANQMAVAIENARLYARVNRRTKQLDSLLQISKTVTSTLNLDEVLRRLSDQMCKLLRLDGCVLLLADELSGRLRFGYGSGLRTRRKSAYYDLAAPLASYVNRTGRKLMMPDVQSSRPFATNIAAAEGIRSVICLPLRNEGILVGIAVGFSRVTTLLPRSQMNILRPLSELAAVAIRNARVYRQKYKMAEILKQRLVPEQVPRIEGLQIGHKFLPARDVGGDYYDFIEAGPRQLGVVVGDVAGSDVEAAEYTTMGKHVLRAYARYHMSPADVLMHTNELVCQDARGEMFISLFYGVIDVDAMKLSYANAGCEPAILYKASEGCARTLTSGGILLGIRAGMTYEQHEVELGAGDVIAVYTDGLTEAGLGNDRFGRDAVMEALRANAHFDAHQIADNLHDALVEFCHGRIMDDVAMVILKLAAC